MATIEKAKSHPKNPPRRAGGWVCSLLFWSEDGGCWVIRELLVAG